MLRTLGGRNLGKCRLRAHQHPLWPPLSNHCQATVEPVPMQNIQGKTRRQRVMNACWRDVLRMRAEDRLSRASILDFRAKLENRCKDFPENNLLRASILDFKPRLANRCKVFPVYTLFRASILDFVPRLRNRCKVFPVYTLFRASILDFRPRLANRCSGE